MSKWFRVTKPVPTRAIGKCPWCERHDVILHLLAVNVDGIGLCCEYVCAKCLDAMDTLHKQEAITQVVLNNPEVKVSEDG